jgi:hypothetical protein
MIHVLTVHWQSAQWIDIQLGYLQRHLHRPVRLYACLSGVPGDHAGKFDYVSTDRIKSHGVKLNRLAAVACARAEGAEDVLVFLDGDAFPIGDLGAYLDRRLDTHPLVAVQRLENLGDCQPHPCFAATTVGLWQRIRGDWTEGFSWNTSDGHRKTDVGGNLLRILRDQGVDWLPMRRSNGSNPHPLLFAIYDNIVYHHGAGFRSGVSSVDRARFGLRDVRPWILAHPWFAFHPLQKRYKQLQADNTRLKQEMFEAICADDTFYVRLQ